MPTFLKATSPPSSMSEDGDDVRRALTIVFRGADGLARPDVERAFSFDMEWVAPHEAEEVVNALVSAGWLEERKQKLHLALDLGEVNVPFGWFPRPTRLMRPVSVTSGPEVPSTTETNVAEVIPSTPDTQTARNPARVETALTGDPRARLTPRVAKFISRQSGLDLEELQRRADRKIKAFHLVTPWMAYALVAREQGLVMDDIAKALDVA